MKHRQTLLGIGLAAVGFAAAAMAGPLEDLAAPGPCAEPRADPRAAPQQGFDVAGGPLEHFDPTDVALRGGAPPFVPPEALAFSRTSCDAPTAACGFGVDGIGESPTVPSPLPGGDPR